MIITITIPVTNEAEALTGFLAMMPHDAGSVLSDQEHITQEIEQWFNKQYILGKRRLAVNTVPLSIDIFKE